jgi:hypothetical protein
MKADRRRELKANTLAQVMNDLPLYLRFHANKFLIGAIILSLVVLLVRYRNNAARQQMEDIRTSLESARINIDQLRTADRSQVNDMGRRQERVRIATDANTQIDKVLEGVGEGDQPGLRAAALLTRGDLYWTLANLPPLPGSTTQPSLAMPHTQAEYLKEAEATYQDVLLKYDSQKVAKASVLLGLAAIEENRGNWDKALGYYSQVQSSTDIAMTFKNLARVRQSLIPEIRTPVFLGSFSSTQPSTTEPATRETAATPTTQPAPSTSPQ